MVTEQEWGSCLGERPAHGARRRVRHEGGSDRECRVAGPRDANAVEWPGVTLSVSAGAGHEGPEDLSRASGLSRGPREPVKVFR